MINFLTSCYPSYEQNYISWQSTIDKILSKVDSSKLHNINGVKITERELTIINNIKNPAIERLMFTLLCLAKFRNAKNENNNNWVNTSIKTIFTLARVSNTIIEQDLKINKLYQMGLIDFPKRNDSLNIQVLFVDEVGEEKLFISDFRELGYEYMKYKGGNFFRCGECGILSKQTKNGISKYCKSCKVYVPQNTKIVICEDCGTPFEISSKNNKTKRCAICQKEADKERKRIWKQNNN